MAICWERPVPLAFHLCCFYFSTVVPVYLAPWTACPAGGGGGASQPRLACPPPWLSSPLGGKLSRPVYLAPRVTKWIKSCLLQCFGTFKIPLLMFISILVFRPEGQIWNPVRRDTRIYVRRILNASRISKTQLKSCTISPS